MNKVGPVLLVGSSLLAGLLVVSQVATLYGTLRPLSITAKEDCEDDLGDDCAGSSFEVNVAFGLLRCCMAFSLLFPMVVFLYGGWNEFMVPCLSGYEETSTQPTMFTFVNVIFVVDVISLFLGTWFGYGTLWALERATKGTSGGYQETLEDQTVIAESLSACSLTSLLIQLVACGVTLVIAWKRSS